MVIWRLEVTEVLLRRVHYVNMHFYVHSPPPLRYGPSIDQDPVVVLTCSDIVLYNWE